MSLAPARSRGAFLKARLAVNGIQCAAKSLGTLTAGDCGLLSNMAASLFGTCCGWDLATGYQLRLTAETANCSTCFSSIGRFEGAQRDAQRVGEAVRGVGHFNLAIQLLAKRFDQPGSEALPARRVNRRAAAFGPGQTQPSGLFVDGPADSDTSGGHRQRAKFGGVGAEFV